MRTALQQAYNTNNADDQLGEIHVEAIEWHSVLHQLETVDQRMNKINLDSIRGLRTFFNEYLADVLYYFTPFHGQAILDAVSKQLNEAHARFQVKYPGFHGPKIICGFSLGGIITYDLLANQGPTQFCDKLHVFPPKITFKPDALFLFGCPIGAVLVMRGQCPRTYNLEEDCRLFNVFHVFDPLVQR